VQWASRVAKWVAGVMQIYSPLPPDHHHHLTMELRLWFQAIRTFRLSLKAIRISISQFRALSQSQRKEPAGEIISIYQRRSVYQFTPDFVAA